MKIRLHVIAVVALLALSGCDSVRHVAISSLATNSTLTDITATLSIRNTKPNYSVAIVCDRPDAAALFGAGSPTSAIPCDIHVNVSRMGVTVVDTNVLNAAIGSYAPPNGLECNLLWFRAPAKGIYTLRITENKPTPFFGASSNCVLSVSHLVPNGFEFRKSVILRSEK